jgi:hypothetical protein
MSPRAFHLPALLGLQRLYETTAVGKCVRFKNKAKALSSVPIRRLRLVWKISNSVSLLILTCLFQFTFRPWLVHLCVRWDWNANEQRCLLFIFTFLPSPFLYWFGKVELQNPTLSLCVTEEKSEYGSVLSSHTPQPCVAVVWLTDRLIIWCMDCSDQHHSGDIS